MGYITALCPPFTSQTGTKEELEDPPLIVTLYFLTVRLHIKLCKLSHSLGQSHLTSQCYNIRPKH